MVATVVVAAIGCSVGMLPSTLASPSGGVSTLSPATQLVLLGAALFGAGAGSAFGFAQGLVLRRHARHAGSWI